MVRLMNMQKTKARGRWGVGYSLKGGTQAEIYVEKTRSAYVLGTYTQQ